MITVKSQAELEKVFKAIEAINWSAPTCQLTSQMCSEGAKLFAKKYWNQKSILFVSISLNTKNEIGLERTESGLFIVFVGDHAKHLQVIVQNALKEG